MPRKVSKSTVSTKYTLTRLWYESYRMTHIDIYRMSHTDQMLEMAVLVEDYFSKVCKRPCHLVA